MSNATLPDQHKREENKAAGPADRPVTVTFVYSDGVKIKVKMSAEDYVDLINFRKDAYTALAVWSRIDLDGNPYSLNVSSSVAHAILVESDVDS